MANAEDKKLDAMTPEELKAEQDALKSITEDEVRAKVVEDFGFDETADADKIDKLVNERVEGHKRLSTAIGQKIKHRNDADTLRKNAPKPPTEDEKKKADEQLSKKIADGVKAGLEQRDVESLTFPKELKEEIVRVAELSGKTVREVMADPYIESKISQHKKDVEAEEAAVKRAGGKGGKGGGKADINNPPEVDMRTPEGRATWEKWKKDVSNQG